MRSFFYYSFLFDRDHDDAYIILLLLLYIIIRTSLSHLAGDVEQEKYRRGILTPRRTGTRQNRCPAPRLGHPSNASRITTRPLRLFSKVWSSSIVWADFFFPSIRLKRVQFSYISLILYGFFSIIIINTAITHTYVPLLKKCVPIL